MQVTVFFLFALFLVVFYILYILFSSLILVSVLFLILSCPLRSVCPVLPSVLLQHLWMISRVRWKQDEDTQPALHIHLSFCSLHSPDYSLQSLSLYALCPLSLHPLCVPAVIHSPQTPLQFILSSAFLSPTVLYPLSAPPLHPRWTECPLCSKINFEMNEGMAVCASSMIFCQKCSEGYFLMHLLPRHCTFVTCSFLGLCSGV